MFDYRGALNEGYTDEEIFGFLKKDRTDFDFDGALNEGYTPAQVNEHISQLDRQPPPVSSLGQSAPITVNRPKNVAEPSVTQVPKTMLMDETAVTPAKIPSPAKAFVSGVGDMAAGLTQVVASDLTTPLRGATMEMDEPQRVMYDYGKKVVESGKNTKTFYDRVSADFYNEKNLRIAKDAKSTEAGEFLNKVAENLRNKPDDERKNIEDAQFWLKQPAAALPQNWGRTAAAAATVAAESGAMTALAMVPFAGQAAMVGTEAGSWIDEARESGIDDSEIINNYSKLYGLISGGVEAVGGEILTAPVKGLGGKITKKIASKVVSDQVKKNLAKKILNSSFEGLGNIAIGALGEGGEEYSQGYISDVLKYKALLESAQKNPDKAEQYIAAAGQINLKPTAKERLNAAYFGAIAGGFTRGALGTVGKTVTTAAAAGKKPEVAPVAEVPAAPEPIGKLLSSFGLTEDQYYAKPEEERTKIFDQLTDPERERLLNNQPAEQAKPSEPDKAQEPLQPSEEPADIEAKDPEYQNRIRDLAKTLQVAKDKKLVNDVVESMTPDEAKDVLRASRGIPAVDVSKIPQEELEQAAAYAKEGRTPLGPRQYKEGALPDIDKKMRYMALDSNTDLEELGPKIEKELDDRAVTFKLVEPGIAQPGVVAKPPTMSFRDEYTGSNINIPAGATVDDLKKKIDDGRAADPEAVAKTIGGKLGLEYVDKTPVMSAAGGVGKYDTEYIYKFKDKAGNTVPIQKGDTVEKLKTYLERKAANEQQMQQAGKKTETEITPPEPRAEVERVQPVPVESPPAPSKIKLQTRALDVILNRYIKNGTTEGGNATELHRNVTDLAKRADPIDLAEAAGISVDEAKAASEDLIANKNTDVSKKVREAFAPNLLYGQSVDEVLNQITEPRDANGRLLFSKKESKVPLLNESDKRGAVDKLFGNLSEDRAQDLDDGADFKNLQEEIDYELANEYRADIEHAVNYRDEVELPQLLEKLGKKRADLEKEAQLKSELSAAGGKSIHSPAGRRGRIPTVEKDLKDNVVLLTYSPIGGSVVKITKKRRDGTTSEKTMHRTFDSISKEVGPRIGKAIMEHMNQKKGTPPRGIFSDLDIAYYLDRRGSKFSRKERAPIADRSPVDQTPEDTAISEAVYKSQGKTPTPAVIRIIEGDKQLTDTLEKATGKKIVWLDIDDNQIQKDLGHTFNGFMFRGAKNPELADKIFINKNTDKPAEWIVYHEFTHFVQQNPEYEAAFWDAAKLTTKGKELVLRKGREEAMADIAGEMMADPKFWEALSENKSIFRALIDEIIKIYDRIISAFKGKKGSQYETILENAQTVRETLQGIMRDYSEGSTGEGMTADSKEKSDPFFSPLLKAVQDMKQQKGTGEQFFNMLTKTPGVKEAEWKWMGLDDFLKGKQSVTRQEVEDFVRENQVQVEEVEKGAKEENINWKENNDGSYSFTDSDNGRWKIVEDEYRDGLYKVKYDDNNYGGERFDSAGEAMLYVADRVKKFPTLETKYSQYQLPGGENYREVLLRLPTEEERLEARADVSKWKAVEQKKDGAFTSMFMPIFDIIDQDGKNIGRISAESEREALDKAIDAFKKGNNVQAAVYEKERKNKFRSSHWDEPNVIAHIRMNDREVSGEKVLFVEEIQSDWAREAREKGITKKPKREDVDIKKVDGEEGWSIVFKSSGDIYSATSFVSKESAEKYIEEGKLPETNGVPAQPFLKNWEELTLKRILRLAAEEGYDRVAWINGEQTAERYDLSKRIDRIEYKKIKGMYHIRAFGVDGRSTPVLENYYDAEELPGVVGKDIAKKIVDDAGVVVQKDVPEVKEISGIDLKTGGEWASALYDRMIPKFYEKYGKKWGVKVETVNLQTISGATEIPDSNWSAVNRVGGQQGFDTKEEAEEFIKENPTWILREPGEVGYRITQQSIPITPEMASSVLYEGQPLFSKVDQTKTEAFKKWFSGSKVVDENGEPLVVYHGTGTTINQFSYDFTEKGNDQFGSGFYFTNKKETAEGYTRNRIQSDVKKLGGEDNPNVIDAYLSIQNPIIVDGSKSPRESYPSLNKVQIRKLITSAPDIKNPDGPIANWGDVKYEGYLNVLKGAIEAYVGDTNATFAIANDFYSGNIKIFLEKYKEVTGYDGVIVNFPTGEKHYIAWFPTQIKSASKNSGTFDPDSPDIRFSKKRREPQPKRDREALVESSVEDATGQNRSVNTTYYQIDDIQRKRAALKRKLGKLKDETLDERLRLTEDIARLDVMNRDAVLAAIYQYAENIGLRGEAYSMVDRIMKTSKGKTGLLRAVEIMDNTLERRHHTRFFKAAETAIADAYTYLNRIAGKTRATTDLETNRALRDYLTQITGGTEEEKRQADMMVRYYNEYGDEDLRQNRNTYVEELGADVIDWIEGGQTGPVPDRAKRLMKSLASKGLQSMSNTQLVRIVSDLKNLRREGRTMKALQEAQRRERFERDTKSIAATIAANAKQKPKSRADVAFNPEREKREGMVRTTGNLEYDLTDSERIIQKLAGERGRSLFKRTVFDPLYAADTEKKRGVKSALKWYQGAHRDPDTGKQVSMAEVRRPFINLAMESREGDGELKTIEKPVTIAYLMKMYAHSQNQSQREHLIWTLMEPSKKASKTDRMAENDLKRAVAEATIDKAVAALPEKYKDMVRKSWKHFDEEQWQRINKVFSEEHGIDMPKEKFYFPIKGLQLEREGAGIEADLLARAGMRAGVSKGFTKGRVNSTAALGSSDYFDDLTSNMLQTEHYIAFSKPIREVSRMLNQVDVRRAIKAYSEPAWTAIDDWVKAMAYGRMNYGTKDGQYDKWIRRLRNNYSVFQLGLKPLTVALQTASWFKGLSGVGKVQALSSLARFARNPAQFNRGINEKSAQQESRMQNYEQGIQEAIEDNMRQTAVGDLKTRQAVAEALRQAVMAPMGWVDKGVSNLIWDAKYHESLDAGKSEEDAIYDADELVRKTQSGGGILASNQFMRGSELQRMFTQFQSDPTKTANMMLEFKNHFDEMTPTEKMNTVMWGVIAPALVVYAIRNLRWPWEEPEEVVKEAERSIVSGIPFVGAIFDAIATFGLDQVKKARGLPVDKSTYNYIADMDAPLLSPMANIGSGILKGDLGKLAEGVGGMAGLPAGFQIIRTIENADIAIKQGNAKYLILSKKAVNKEFDDVARMMHSRPSATNKISYVKKMHENAQEILESWTPEKKAAFIEYQKTNAQIRAEQRKPPK